MKGITAEIFFDYNRTVFMQTAKYYIEILMLEIK